jgi:type I restriction enzyme S subunit
MSSEPQMDTDKRGLVPRLRFPEFRGAGMWEEKRLKDALDYERPDKYIVTDTNYHQSGIPVLTANKSFILGCTHEENGIFTNTPVIIFDDFTVDKKYVDFSFKVKSSAIKILKIKGENNLKFIYELMNIIKFETAEHKRNYISVYQNLCIRLPRPYEQKKIADCLSSLDEVITRQTQKIDALKAHKTGLMQQLFPREGETLPHLRFPEFRNARAWGVNPIGELLPVTSSKRVHQKDWATEGIPFYRARDLVALKNKEVIEPLYISKSLYEENVRSCGKIKPSDLLVTGVGTIGIPYLVKKSDIFYFKDGNIIWIKNDEKSIVGQYLFHMFDSEYLQSQIQTMSGVGTVGTYTITNANATLIAYPSNRKEQHKIADCLSSLDEVITRQTQKIDALKAHKTGLMQQLFPSGETVG